MAAGDYSFIDVAVLGPIRERFARADALAVLTVSLDEILWANGPGAALFGYPDIETIMGAESGLSPAARRQIAATPGFPEVAGARTVMVRLSRGITSGASQLEVSAVRLPDGEAGILLAQNGPASASRSAAETAARAISGIGDQGHHGALLGSDGLVLAASAGFAGLGLGRDPLRRLTAEVSAGSRVAKRMISGGERAFPAGLARLTDAPALHLLLVIDETEARGEEAESEPAEVVAVREVAAEAQASELVETSDPAPEQTAAEHGPVVDLPEAAAAISDMQELPTDEMAQDEDDGPADAVLPTEEPAAAAPAAAPLPSFPVRFVWRTDAEGRFSALSPEFAAAMGVAPETIVGRLFREVAGELGFDREGEIAALLERRDTWSGRTVLWPLSGRGLRVPVDLAALPVYGRERNFEGFRGFGVARLGDAVAEEPAPEPEKDLQEEPAPARADPFLGERPAIAVEPTPERRSSDKVIRLAERRPPAPERVLSAADESVFREIGKRLRTETGEADGPADTAADTPEPLPEAAAPLSAEAQDDAAPEPQLSAIPVETDEDVSERIDDEPAAPDQPDAPSIDEAAAAETVGHTEAEPARSAQIIVPSAFALPRPPEPAPADTSILAQLPTPVLIHSGDLMHYANRAFLELTGYDSLNELEAAGGLGELFADPLEEGPEDDRAVILRRQDGDMLPVEALLRAVPWRGRRALMLVLRDAAPEPAPRVIQLRDAAGPSRSELEARVAEMRTILDTATDGVVLIAPDDTIRSLNRPAEALFGFDREDVVGKPFVSLFAVESQRSARDYLAGLADNGVASVLNDGREVIGREAQGGFIPLFMTIGKLPGDSGYCAVMRDITPWKRAEEELTQARAQAERASSQKTEFLARISHEIRTPLNAIIGFSELMVDEKFGPVGNERYRDYLRDINRSGNLVLDLVNDLLDISKIEAGEQEMSYEAVSLNETLSETVAMMQPQANRERVIIRSSFASRLPEIVADLRSIRQIALNLLSNAVRYTQAGGQVIVSTSLETSGDVVIRVRDTGIGMSAAEVEQALKPFKQINALKRGRGDGTGLGLPLTKAMVEANRARLHIHSTPGEGTLVEVVFPATRVLSE